MTNKQAGRVNHIVAVRGKTTTYAIETSITRWQAGKMREDGFEVLEIDTKTGAKVAKVKVRG